MHAIVQMIEVQRRGSDILFNAVHVVTCLCGLGLETAINSAWPQKFREGVAVDYVHWVGRLMRSEAALSRFDISNGMTDLWRDDVAFLARKFLVAKADLGEPVHAAVNLVMDDSFVATEFKALLDPKC